MSARRLPHQPSQGLRSRLARAAALVLALTAIVGLGAGCGATAGDGQTNPPSTSPK